MKKDVVNKDTVDKVGYLDIRDIQLEQTEGGFIRMQKNGETYQRVNFYRCFPLSKPDAYISVRDTEKNELGMIRDLGELDPAYAEMIRYDLDRRYFTPEITKINTVKDEYGYVYMDVETTSGQKHITVPSGSSNFILLSEVRLILIDIDGNRFSITDYTKLEEKSIRLLETLI